LNIAQRLVLVAFAVAVILLCVFFVPFTCQHGGWEYGSYRAVHYLPVFNAVTREDKEPTLESTRLAVELIACGFVFAALFLAVGKGGKKTDL
jgi:uncharacterized membrane protein